MVRKGIRIKKGKLPGSPGVYLMKDAAGKILYVGKAGNLKRRVESYFLRPHDYRIQKLVSEIRRIDYEETGTAIEALIREATLIKKLEPPYNVREKDDKSFLYVVITHEKFPRVLLVRGKDRPTHGTIYGPFTSATGIREALRILRRIFPWSEHQSVGSEQSAVSRTKKLQTVNRKPQSGKPCFNYQIGLCPGTCCGAISAQEYRKTINQLKLFLGGRRKRLIPLLEREMRVASKELNFEQAEKLRRRIFALQHIQDVALIADDSEQFAVSSAARSTRIEGYDISNISGTLAVGSMVVFINGKPDKNEYRKFRIRAVAGPDDTGMLREVLLRRFRHAEWRYPDLILVDGGVAQVNAAKQALRTLKLRVPVVGIAKGPERKRTDVIGFIPSTFAKATVGNAGIDKTTLIRVRDEAHRFAISYHKQIRKRNFLSRS